MVIVAHDCRIKKAITPLHNSLDAVKAFLSQ
jgi:hypothetical protein